jgi:hypothetical protein
MNKWIDEHMTWIVLIAFAVIMIAIAYFIFTSIMPLSSSNITSKDLIV